jgi:hypothetical protein
MGYTKFSIIIGFIFAFINVYPQETDFQTWYNADIKAEFFKKLDVVVSPEIRTFDNSSRIATMLCEIDFSIPITKYFRIGGIYRPEVDISGDYASKRNRFCIYGEAQYKLKRFRLNYRGIYQQEYKDYNNSESGHIPIIQHRQKIGLKYNIKNSKITPSASVEMFFNLRPIEDKGQNKLRASIGLEYPINKKLSCAISYKFQREYYVKNPQTAHIISLSLGYEL